jgi:hypothetical protein
MSAVILAFMFLVVCGCVYQAWSIRRSLNSDGKTGGGGASRDRVSANFHCNVDVATGVRRDEGMFFSVKVRGKVIAPHEGCNANVQVTIVDITEGLKNAKPVCSTASQWQSDDSDDFCYRANIGRMNKRVNELSEWMEVANFGSLALEFVRSGKRKLKFVVSVIASDDGTELARAIKVLKFQHDGEGYVDAQESNEQIESLTVMLASDMCVYKKKYNVAAADVVSQWIAMKADAESQVQDEDMAEKLNGQLVRAVDELKHGRSIDTKRVCKKLRDASSSERLAAMELCMQAVRAFGQCSAQQRQELTAIGEMLEIEEDKFRFLGQKVLPLSMHDEKDYQFVLGVTKDMEAEQIRSRLNEEYRKWNGRVTHADADMQQQAGEMLELIADVRAKFVEVSV